MRSGSFTLLELVIVVIIIAVLAGLGITQYQKVVYKADLAELNTTLGMIVRAKQAHFAQYGTYRGVPDYAADDCLAGWGYAPGSTRIQRDLGISIPNDKFRYLIYPSADYPNVHTIYFLKEGEACDGGAWACRYNYLADEIRTYTANIDCDMRRYYCPTPRPF